MANERQQKLQEEANRLGKQYDIPALGDLIVATALRYDLDPTIFLALVKQESGFNPKNVSPVGAQGLGQLMPGTARGLGVQDPFDPVENLDGAARYLKQQLETFGNYTLALAAYNAGPGNVQQYGGVPPFPETQNYVRSIMANTNSPVRVPGLASFVPPAPSLSPEPAKPAEDIAAQAPEAQKKSLVQRIIEKVLQILDLTFQGPYSDALKHGLERKSNRELLDLGVQLGSFTELEKKQILDRAPLGVYETEFERAFRLNQEKAKQKAAAASAGETTTTGETTQPPIDEEQAAREAAEKAAREAAEALAQAQNKSASEQSAITGLIALLGQRIASGTLSLRQAEDQLDRFFKQKGLELSRATEEGTRLSEANTQLLQALPFVAPPGMQFFPGFEPGGAIQQITHGTVSPIPITRVQFNPYNQVAPVRNVDLEQPPNPPALTQPFDLNPAFAAVENMLKKILGEQTPAFISKANESPMGGP